MLTLDDCVACSDLSEEEIAAIAEHEHVPTIIALEMGSTLVDSPDGCRAIKRIIEDDVNRAMDKGNIRHVRELERTLSRFVRSHRYELKH